VELTARSPHCARCGADLAMSARYCALEVPSYEQGSERTPLTVALVFCRLCGTVVAPAE
jgi:hypothetical protein